MRKNCFSGLAVVLAGALIASGCSGNETVAPFDEVTPTTVEEDASTGFIGAPDGLAFSEGTDLLRISVPNLIYSAPHELEETNAVQVLLTDLLTDGLTQRSHSHGVVEPAIADFWEVSDDGLTWTFTIGEATFANGTQITADDVVVSLNRLADRGVTSVSAPNLWPVEGWNDAGLGDGSPEVSGIVALSDFEVQFTLTEPFAALGEVLSSVSFGITPADESSLLATQGEMPNSSAQDFAPSAVFTDALTLELRRGADNPMRTIEILVDPELTMLAAGESDVAIGFDDAVGGTTTSSVSGGATSYFALNASVVPFNDPLIRQAILHAVDSSALRDEYFPGTDVMTRLVAAVAIDGVTNACGAACEYDLDQARTLIQASSNRDSVLTIDFIDPLANDENSADDAAPGIDEQLATTTAEMLTEAGLSVEVVGHSPADFSRLAAEGRLGMFRFGSVSTTLSPEASIGLSFHSEGSDNVTRTSIPRVDTLIDQARAATSDSTRQDLYNDAERVLFAEAVVLPLVQFHHTVVLGERVEELGLEADGSLNLEQVEFAEPAE